MTARTRFGPIQVEYDARVLRPRAWTLAQSRWAADLLATAPPGPFLELCAGAGHIGLAAAVLAGRPVVLVDSSAVACAFARRNALHAGVAAEVRRADLGEAVAPQERFPLVLADPPYLPSADTGLFPEDPLPAIDGGPDGLDLARRCLAVAEGALAPGGALLLQLRGPDQADALADELHPAGGPLAVARRRDLARGTLLLLSRRDAAAAGSPDR